MATIRDIFGPDGPYAQAFPGYEPREGQILLSQACHDAILDGEHLIAEAPTGTGKSAAYITAALAAAVPRGKKVVIATANIALQEQIIEKDLPLAARVLGSPVRYALLKGINNFACLDARAELDAGVHRKLPIYQQVEDLRRWAHETATGDMSELSHVPSADVWGMISVGSDECKREHCEFSEDCFSRKARERAREADLVVTNYHLLFAHLALKAVTGQDLILPSFDVLICDEFHECESIAADFFGFQISFFSLLRLSRKLKKLGAAAQHGDQAARRLEDAGHKFFGWLAEHARSPRYKTRLREVFTNHEDVCNALSAVAVAAKSVNTDKLEQKEKPVPGQIADGATRLMVQINEAMTERSLRSVYFIETDRQDRARLKCKLVSCAGMLTESMWIPIQTVIGVSATLATGRGSTRFDFMRARLGVPDDANELVVDSPFDHHRQALLVVPDKICEPNEKGFTNDLSDVIERVALAAGGRTLALFTSYRNLQACHEAVRYRVKYPCLKQGDAPRTELTRRFRDDEATCLFGTESFWTGIDIQGTSLVAVVIDKLPFPSPDDPVLDAIQAQDREAFFRYSVPLATIKLRQGVGRLIRSRRDFGVVVICDTRIASKRYGKEIRAALPAMRATRDLANVAHFLAEHGHVAEPPDDPETVPGDDFEDPIPF